jgi:ATP/maltotriose-dependent transcriptional regulator MalT
VAGAAAAARGEVAEAERWAEERGLGAKDEPSYPREGEYLVLARLLLAQQQPDQALGLLERLHAQAIAQGRTGSVIEVAALQSLALAAAGDQAAGLGALAEALALAGPEGYVRAFQPGRRAAAPTTPQLAGVAGLVEPLSDRELEVLGLLAAGRSNQQIADELVVVLDTVKNMSAISSKSWGRPTAPRRSPAPGRSGCCGRPATGCCMHPLGTAWPRPQLHPPGALSGDALDPCQP